MAKKASNKGKGTHKNMTKVIIPVKSEKGSYTFKEEMILADKLEETLKRYSR